MVSGKNWRIDVDAQTYFGNEQKAANIRDRQPVTRRSSDLVGPGIGAAAVRLTDLTDLLATYDGYYSAAVGALGAPGLVTTTLSAGLSTGAAITALPVAALPSTLLTDQKVAVSSGDNRQVFTVSAITAAGATSIPVVSQAPNFAYPSGSRAASSEPLIGTVTMDSDLGGVQRFTGLITGNEYQRVFLRAENDPDTLTWGPWDGVYIAPTLLNSWVNYGSPYATAGYTKIAGVVYLRGLIRFGVIGDPAFQLPPRYRLSAAAIFTSINASVTSGSTVAGGTAHTHAITNISSRVNIDPNGDVTPAFGTNGFVSLAGINFPAEY